MTSEDRGADQPKPRLNPEAPAPPGAPDFEVPEPEIPEYDDRALPDEDVEPDAGITEPPD